MCVFHNQYKRFLKSLYIPAKTMLNYDEFKNKKKNLDNQKNNIKKKQEELKKKKLIIQQQEVQMKMKKQSKMPDISGGQDYYK